MFSLVYSRNKQSSNSSCYLSSGNVANSCYVFRHYIFSLFMKTCEIPSSTIFSSSAKTAEMPGILLTFCFQLCVNVTHFSQCRQTFPRFGIQELVSKYRELTGGFKPVRGGEIFVLKER